MHACIPLPFYYCCERTLGLAGESASLRRRSRRRTSQTAPTASPSLAFFAFPLVAHLPKKKRRMDVRSRAGPQPKEPSFAMEQVCFCTAAAGTKSPHKFQCISHLEIQFYCSHRQFDKKIPDICCKIRLYNMDVRNNITKIVIMF